MYPDYERSVGLRPANQANINVDASPSAFGMDIAQGVSDLGQGINETLEARAIMKGVEARATAVERQNLFDQEVFSILNDPDTGYMNLSGKDAMSARQVAEEKIAAARAKYADGLDEQARKFYDSQSVQRQTDAFNRVKLHAVQERSRWITDTFTSRAELAKEDAVSAVSERDAFSSIQRGMQDIDNLGKFQGLPPEKIDLMRKEYASGAIVSYATQLAQKDPIAAAQYIQKHSETLTGRDQYNMMQGLKKPVADEISRRSSAYATDAASILMEFEGYREKAYFDTNAYRGGYGSDTMTLDDGTVVKVTKESRVTKEAARRDLDRRLIEVNNGIEKKVGKEMWGIQPLSVTEPIKSVAYNYGSLPDRVSKVIARGGSREEIATAVESLAGDNGGINRRRRMAEAAMIRGGPGAPLIMDEQSRQVVDNLPDYQKRVMESSIQESFNAQSIATEGEIKRAAAQENNRVNLEIETGGISTEAEILANPLLDDGQKAARIKQFRGAAAERISYSAAVTRMAQEGTLGTNIVDPQSRKIADKYYENAAIDAESIIKPDYTGEPARAFLRDFVARESYVPDKAAKIILGGVYSRNPDQVGLSMEVAENLHSISPYAFKRVANSKEFEDMVTEYQTDLQRGFSTRQIGERYLERRSPEFAKKREAAKLTLGKFMKNVDLSDAPDLPASSGVSPQQTLYLNAEYRALVEENYITWGGDEELAKQNAVKTIKQTWAYTNLFNPSYFGSRMMKYAPEAIYPPIDGGHDYIKRQVIQQVRDNIGDQEFNSIDKNEIFIGSFIDPMTGQDHTSEDARALLDGRPISPIYESTKEFLEDKSLEDRSQASKFGIRYAVYYADKDGTIQILPKAFIPDLSSERTSILKRIARGELKIEDEASRQEKILREKITEANLYEGTGYPAIRDIPPSELGE